MENKIVDMEKRIEFLENIIMNLLKDKNLDKYSCNYCDCCGNEKIIENYYIYKCCFTECETIVYHCNKCNERIRDEVRCHMHYALL